MVYLNYHKYQKIPLIVPPNIHNEISENLTSQN